jgi:type VI secretion system protein ImpC
MENNTKIEALKSLLYRSEIIQLSSQENYAIEMMDNFFKLVSLNNPTIKNSEDFCNFVDNEISNAQEEISFYLNCILHDPKFQRLEGSWRSIGDLVKNSEVGSDLKIQLMNVTIDAMIEDIDKAADFDQSLLFKKMYEENFGTPGGEPISCIILDHYFTKSPADVKLMCDLANIFSAAHIQTIASVHPSVFDLKDFSQLNDPVDMRAIFESPELINWNAFRLKDEARYLTLVMPRILKRLPYNSLSNPIKSINFQEEVGANSIDNFTWGNAAYAMANRITNAYSLYEWVASIRGVENGGKVDNMPIYTYRTNTGEEFVLCPTETSITDRREKELSDLGFLSLCYFKQTDYSVFFSSQTTIKPQIYDNPIATGNAALSSSLPFMLIASRFAHYMKCMMRDYIGSNMTKEEVQQYLQSWIARYVTLNETADSETKRRYPLKQAAVEVEERPGEVGHYYAIVRIIPHFQLESINISTRLVVDLPKKA